MGGGNPLKKLSKELARFDKNYGAQKISNEVRNLDYYQEERLRQKRKAEKEQAGRDALARRNQNKRDAAAEMGANRGRGANAQAGRADRAGGGEGIGSTLLSASRERDTQLGEAGGSIGRKTLLGG